MRYPFDGQFRLTQAFGANPEAYKQFGIRGHNGLDFALPSGTPVLAAMDGQASALEDPSGFGHYIEVIGSDYKTVYAHLQDFKITNGSRVKEGQLIGWSDNTGNSTGPHLHFGVKPINPDKNNGYLGAIDPKPLLTEGGNMSTLVDRNIAIDLGVGILGRSIADAQQQDYLKSVIGQDVATVIRNLMNSGEAKAFRARANAPQSKPLSDYALDELFKAAVAKAK